MKVNPSFLQFSAIVKYQSDKAHTVKQSGENVKPFEVLKVILAKMWHSTAWGWI